MHFSCIPHSPITNAYNCSNKFESFSLVIPPKSEPFYHNVPNEPADVLHFILLISAVVRVANVALRFTLGVANVVHLLPHFHPQEHWYQSYGHSQQQYYVVQFFPNGCTWISWIWPRKWCNWVWEKRTMVHQNDWDRNNQHDKQGKSHI